MKLQLFVGSLITPFHTPLPFPLNKGKVNKDFHFFRCSSMSDYRRPGLSQLPSARSPLPLKPLRVRYAINYNEVGPGWGWHWCQNLRLASFNFRITAVKLEKRFERVIIVVSFSSTILCRVLLPGGLKMLFKVPFLLSTHPIVWLQLAHSVILEPGVIILLLFCC